MGEKTVMSFIRNGRNEIVTEVAKITDVDCSDGAPEKSKYFTNTENPIWIIIRFRRPLTEDELVELYNICTHYRLFEIDDVLEEIKKDIEHDFPSHWNIKFSGPFEDAWNACYDIQNSAFDFDDRQDKYDVKISDSAPEGRYPWESEQSKTASEGQA